MSILLVLATAGATYIGGLQTPLQLSEAEELGIQITATDLEAEVQHPHPLFLFRIDLENFHACDAAAVGIHFSNQDGELIFAASLSEALGSYHFQILEQYLNTATLTVTCDAGPEALDSSYTINLRGYSQAP